MSWLGACDVRIVMKTFSLSLDSFGRDTLAAEAALVGAGTGEVLRLAVRHYLSELEGDRFALRVPAFARGARRRPGTEVGVELEERDRAALVSEADRQGLDMEDLLGHAALLYLADRDAGRVEL
jgi:hypothetical protein